MIYYLRQIQESSINELLAHPEQVLDFIENGEGEDKDETTAKREIDLDKAWHGIHFLLTGSAWGGDPPFHYLIDGGQAVGDVEVGYGPARILHPQEVSDFAKALTSLTVDDLRAWFNPEGMMEAEIYPEIWDRDSAEDDGLDYLLGFFNVLKLFVQEASQLNNGLLAYIL